MQFQVLGSGVVGRFFAAHLAEAGHDVALLTRPERLERFRAEGIRLRARGEDERVVQSVRFISEPEDPRNTDFVLGCFRGEQREELRELLAPFDMTATRLVVCFPVWRELLHDFTVWAPRTAYCLPGVAGIYDDETIKYKADVTRVQPVAEGDDSAGLFAEALQGAGLKARVDDGLGNMMDAACAIGFPFFLALSANRYRYSMTVRDAGLMKRTLRAQRDALDVVREGGTHLPFWARMHRRFPLTPLTVAAQASPLAVRGFIRDMFEIHFAKVDAQSRAMLRELVAISAHRTTSAEHLVALLGQTEHRADADLENNG